MNYFPPLAALALILGANAAGATNFTPVSTLDFSGGYSATFGDSFDSETADLNFSDYFFFTLPSYASGSGASSAITGMNITLNDLIPTVSLGHFDLYSATSGNGQYLLGASPVASGAVSDLVIQNAVYPNALATLSFRNLAMSASYALNVSGTVTHSNGAYQSSGSYAGNISLNPSSIAIVPEPGEWLFMLSGFALFGLVFRKNTLFHE